MPNKNNCYVLAEGAWRRCYQRKMDDHSIFYVYKGKRVNPDSAELDARIVRGSQKKPKPCNKKTENDCSSPCKWEGGKCVVPTFPDKFVTPLTNKCYVLAKGKWRRCYKRASGQYSIRIKNKTVVLSPEQQELISMTDRGPKTL